MGQGGGRVFKANTKPDKWKIRQTDCKTSRHFGMLQRKPIGHLSKNVFNSISFCLRSDYSIVLVNSLNEFLGHFIKELLQKSGDNWTLVLMFLFSKVTEKEWRKGGSTLI